MVSNTFSPKHQALEFALRWHQRSWTTSWHRNPPSGLQGCLSRVPEPKGPKMCETSGWYHPFQVNLMDVKHLGLPCCASNKSVKILIPWWKSKKSGIALHVHGDLTQNKQDRNWIKWIPLKKSTQLPRHLGWHGILRGPSITGHPHLTPWAIDFFA